MAKKYTVSHLATHAESVILQVQQSKQPVCISMGGAAAAIIVDAETYLNQQLALREFERIFRKEAGIRPTWVDQTPECQAIEA